MSTYPQHGLEWKPSPIGFEPSWTVEPDQDVVRDIAMEKLGNLQFCTVEFLAQGAFNKIYTIHCDKGDFVMRVSLPVDPQYKTQSEVATLDFVRRYTQTPVPKVIAFDASSHNKLGFEWILMERMPGKPLRDRWRTLSWTKKQILVKSIALFVAQLYRKRLQSLGNLYDCDKSQDACRDPDSLSQAKTKADFVVDRMVSMELFWADHINHDVPRGPFKSSQEWLSTRLLLYQNDTSRTIETSNDEDDLEDARNISLNVRKLFSLLPSIFRNEPAEISESSALMHEDLSQQNILTDEEGNVTAIVDWECVSALPLWKVCQLPAFLKGVERKDKPVKDNYMHEPEVNELYWEDLLAYERTELRRCFLDEMQRIEPAWFAMYSSTSIRRKTEFELAVHHGDDIFSIKCIAEWLEDVDRGVEKSSLLEKLGGNE